MSEANGNSLDSLVGLSGFRCIVADPPWPYSGRGPASSKEHRPNSYGAAPSSVERYGKMSMDELKAMQIPADASAHLFLWTTNGFICEAHDLGALQVRPAADAILINRKKWLAPDKDAHKADRILVGIAGTIEEALEVERELKRMKKEGTLRRQDYEESGDQTERRQR